MLTRYYQFESLEHCLLTRLRPGDDERPVRCVVFGGTGAVGGAAVLELTRILLSTAPRTIPLRGQIYATGRSDKEITRFAERLYSAFSRGYSIEKLQPRRYYRVAERVDLHFSHLNLGISEDVVSEIHRARDLAQEEGRGFDLEQELLAYFKRLRDPFLDFVRSKEIWSVDAALVAIPLPSVATYTLDAIDALAAEFGLEHAVLNRLKDHYLSSFVNGLSIIQQRYAREVVVAHTTAVGGMYRVDGEGTEIHLGFAHSAMGKLLADKQYFAEHLTQRYIDQGFKVLITAAAIGIDGVEFDIRLPLASGVKRALEAAIKRSPQEPPIPPDDLDRDLILLYPAVRMDLDRDALSHEALRFSRGKDLRFDAVIRSGENGYFSVANTTALYNVMKVAIPEELAAVVVRQMLFGQERRRRWFSEGLCYYVETENAHFAQRVLESDERLLRAHLGAFSIQTFQDLGSSTHQGRLHELGVLVLLLRLLDFGERFESIDEKRLERHLQDLKELLWQVTANPSFEDLLELGTERLGRLLAQLCEVRDKIHLGNLLGYDVRGQARRSQIRERVLARLATLVQRYLWTVTSLGSPILYRATRSGRDKVLIGPYVAPLDSAITSRQDLGKLWQESAAQAGCSVESYRTWSIVNNGFVDLRPHALGTCSREPHADLAADLLTTESETELKRWLSELSQGQYFTTCGLVATRYRLSRLYEELQDRRVELGTHETWKNLFFRDQTVRRGRRRGSNRRGSFILAPGLVETIRMYTEGLGKVTGTEGLWPGWGY